MEQSLPNKITNLKELVNVLENAVSVRDIDRYREDIAKLMPDVRVMYGYDQNNMYHCYDLWMHTLHTVINLPKDLPDDMIYLAALLHDIGKPEARCCGKDPLDKYSHYYDHAKKGAEILTERIIPRLGIHKDELSADDIRRLKYYILHHDDQLGLRIKSLRKQLNEASFDEYKMMLMLQIADAKAHVLMPDVVKRMEICEELLKGKADELYEDILNGK